MLRGWSGFSTQPGEPLGRMSRQSFTSGLKGFDRRLPKDDSTRRCWSKSTKPNIDRTWLRPVYHFIKRLIRVSWTRYYRTRDTGYRTRVLAMLAWDWASISLDHTKTRSSGWSRCLPFRIHFLPFLPVIRLVLPMRESACSNRFGAKCPRRRWKVHRYLVDAERNQQSSDFDTTRVLPFTETGRSDQCIWRLIGYR